MTERVFWTENNRNSSFTTESLKVMCLSSRWQDEGVVFSLLLRVRKVVTLWLCWCPKSWGEFHAPIYTSLEVTSVELLHRVKHETKTAVSSRQPYRTYCADKIVRNNIKSLRPFLLQTSGFIFNLSQFQVPGCCADSYTAMTLHRVI